MAGFFIKKDLFSLNADILENFKNIENNLKAVSDVTDLHAFPVTLSSMCLAIYLVLKCEVGSKNSKKKIMLWTKSAIF